MRICGRLRPLAAVICIGALSAAGCGQWSPSMLTSPAGVPSALDSVPFSGATIQGRVTGGGSGIAPSSVSTPLAVTTTVTVKVIGTNISAPVSASGAFVLENVPAGSIQLQFSSASTNSVATVGTVNTGDRLDLQININLVSAIAVVEASIHIKADNTTEVEGDITAVSGSCPNLSFVVNGWTLKVDSSTQSGCTNVKVGVKVKIKGTLTSTKVVVVVRIDVAGPPSRNDRPGDDDDRDSDSD